MAISDVSAPTIPVISGEINDWVQPFLRVFRDLPVADRRQVVHLLLRDLNEADTDSRTLPSEHPAWDELDRFIQEDRESERAAVESETPTNQQLSVKR